MEGRPTGIQPAFASSAMKRPTAIVKHHGRACVGLLLAAKCTLLNSTTAKAASGIETAGDILQYAVPLAGAGLTLAHRDGEGAIQFGKSLALSVGVTYVLKYSIDAPRPDHGGESMPSGHTSFAFTGAEYIRKRYGLEYGVPAYAAASFVAYSRVEAHRHYPRDVIAGAGIGILSSFIFTKPYNGWSLSIEGDTKSFGMRLSRHF